MAGLAAGELPAQLVRLGNICISVLQPFGGFGFSGGWSLNTSEMVFNYDVERSRWTSLPLGVRVEKLVKLGKMSARLFVDVEHNFADKDVAPENIVRFAFVPLF